MAWWLIWLIPLWIGLRMFLRDEGLVWERTEKTDANHKLVRTTRVRPPAAVPVPVPVLMTAAAPWREQPIAAPIWRTDTERELGIVGDQSSHSTPMSI